MDIAGKNRGTDGVLEDSVFVGFGDGGVAGMEGASYRSRLNDADGSREGAVEGAEEIFGRDVGLEFKAGDLGQGVNAGVGAARALRERGFTGDAAEGGLEFTLDCELAGLDLPAAEVSAVVGEGELEGLRNGLDGIGHGWGGIRFDNRVIEWERCWVLGFGMDVSHSFPGLRWQSRKGWMDQSYASRVKTAS